MAIPSARMSRGAILDQALQRAGNTKIKAKARETLEYKLDELAIGYEWPFLYATTVLTLTGSSFTLPTTNGSEFLKAQDDRGLVVTAVDGELQSVVVMEVDPETFSRLAVPTDATANIPRIWCVNRPGVDASIWPTPTASVVATLRYKFRPAAQPLTPTADYDASIPWFPWPSTLIRIMFQWALEWDADPRADVEFQKVWGVGGELDMLREAAMPRHSQSSVVVLDPLVFSTPFRGD